MAPVVCVTLDISIHCDLFMLIVVDKWSYGQAIEANYSQPHAGAELSYKRDINESAWREQAQKQSG
jgi:hypothetical protein